MVWISITIAGTSDKILRLPRGKRVGEPMVSVLAFPTLHRKIHSGVGTHPQMLTISRIESDDQIWFRWQSNLLRFLSLFFSISTYPPLRAIRLTRFLFSARYFLSSHFQVFHFPLSHWSVSSESCTIFITSTSKEKEKKLGEILRGERWCLIGNFFFIDQYLFCMCLICQRIWYFVTDFCRFFSCSGLVIWICTWDFNRGFSILLRVLLFGFCWVLTVSLLYCWKMKISIGCFTAL